LRYEFGHALSVWLSGGSVRSWCGHPLQLSWTSFSRNPHPQLVAWGGPIWGALLPVVFSVSRDGFARRPLPLSCSSPALSDRQWAVHVGGCIGLVVTGGRWWRSGAAPWELQLFGVVVTPRAFGCGTVLARTSDSARRRDVSAVSRASSRCPIAATVAAGVVVPPLP